MIERDKMYTVNSNLSRTHSILTPGNFKPFSKNPPIAKVFREILLADELGSGMRNSYKYTKLYCGGEPEFSEEDTFTLTIPLTEIANPVVNAPVSVSPDEGTREKTTQKTTQK